MGLSLALLAAWLAVVWVAIGGRGRRWSAERVGMVTLATVVLVFGVHSFVDWTWFIPGNAVLALLCAGWLAGRGPVEDAPPGARGQWRRLQTGVRDRSRALAAAAAILVAVTAAWATFQPLRSQHVSDQALTDLEAKKLDAARSDARRAADINPLSVEPLFDLAVIETIAGRKDAARGALEEAVHVQPSNPRPWLRLAGFDLDVAKQPRAAIDDLGAALYLDPRNSEGIDLYLRAYRSTGDSVPIGGTLPKQSTRPGAAPPAGATKSPGG
jgi:tetratricopeptide (TPR) repeat protein